MGVPSGFCRHGNRRDGTLPRQPFENRVVGIVDHGAFLLCLRYRRVNLPSVAYVRPLPAPTAMGAAFRFAPPIPKQVAASKAA
jgi:hypothetical protein